MSQKLSSAIKQIKFNHVPDERGCLTAAEQGQHIPFEIKRVFFVHHVKSDKDRGGHAHRDTDQVLTCVNDAMQVDVSDGKEIYTYVLNDPAFGIYIPRMLWTRLYNFSSSSVLCVFASTNYDQSRSIRSWQEYIKETGSDIAIEPGKSNCPMPQMIVPREV